MPKLTFRGGTRPEVGDEIRVRIGVKTTIGAVWNIVTKAGEVIAKARVVRDYSRDEKFSKVPKYIDPRSEANRSDTFNAGEKVFGLKIEKTNDDEVLY